VNRLANFVNRLSFVIIMKSGDKKRSIVLATLLFLTACGAETVAEPKQAEKPPVIVDTITLADSKEQLVNLDLSGVIASDNSTQVIAKSSGTITDIDFKIGDKVKKDDLLATIDAAELERMVEELQLEPEESPETVIAELFARREGISLAEIQAYRAEIAKISATINPETGKTIAQEYLALYDRFIKVRWRSRERFRGPVRQSEGEELMDPTMVYIDIVSGDQDPMGFKEMARERIPENVITDIEDDQLLDLTASMEQRSGGSTLLAEQRKMALVHLEELARLNDKMNDVSVKSHLSVPLGVRTSIMGFRGNRLIQLKSNEDPLSEKLRIEVARELQETEAGRGNLLSALQAYRQGIAPEKQAKLKNGTLTKILTVFSDGNMYCTECGKESCNYSINQKERQRIVAEVKKLREMGVIVHGIGFTNKSKDIVALTSPDGVTIADASHAVMARHQLIQQSLNGVVGRR
jgi:biotin carboxyl carrier protein